MGTGLLMLTVVLSLGDLGNLPSKNLGLDDEINKDVIIDKRVDDPIYRYWVNESDLETANYTNKYFCNRYDEDYYNSKTKTRELRIIGLNSSHRDNFSFDIEGKMTPQAHNDPHDTDYYPILVRDGAVVSLEIETSVYLRKYALLNNVEFVYDVYFFSLDTLDQEYTFVTEAKYHHQFQFEEINNNLYTSLNNLTINEMGLLYIAVEARSTLDSGHISRSFMDSLTANYRPSHYFIGGKVSYPVSDDFYNTSKSISTMKFDLGAKMALWYADYDPINYQQKLIKPAKIPLHQRYRASENIENLANGLTNVDSIHEQAILYIFDDDAKIFFEDFILNARREMEPYREELLRKQAKLEKIKKKYDTASRIIGLALAFNDLNDIVISVPKSVGFIKEITDFLVDIVISYLMPTDEINAVERFFDFVDHFREVLPFVSRGEVLRLPTFYRVKENHDICYLDKDETELYQFNYEEDVISYVQGYTNGNRRVKGTIYPIVNEGDFERAINRERLDHERREILPKEVVQLKVPNSNLSNNEYIELEIGEFQWFRFKAPHDDDYSLAIQTKERLTIEFFNNAIPGQQEKGSNDLQVLVDNNNVSGNQTMTPFNYDPRLCFEMKRGDSLLFRVRETDWGEVRNGTSHISIIDMTKTIQYKKIPNTNKHQVIDEHGHVTEELCQADEYYGKKTLPTAYDQIFGYTVDPRICYHCYEMINSRFVKTDLDSCYPGRLTTGTTDDGYYTSTLTWKGLQMWNVELEYALGIKGNNQDFITNTKVRLEAINQAGEWLLITELEASLLIDNQQFNDLLPLDINGIRFIILTKQEVDSHYNSKILIGDILIRERTNYS